MIYEREDLYHNLLSKTYYWLIKGNAILEVLDMDNMAFKMNIYAFVKSFLFVSLLIVHYNIEV